MLRFMIKNNDIKMFDIYDKFLKENQTVYSQVDISKNTTNDILLSDLSYDTDSDYSEMYISEYDFEYVDISKSQPVLKEDEREKTEEKQTKDEKQQDKEEKGQDKEEKQQDKEEKQQDNKEEKKINEETGIIRQSFYKLGNYLFNYNK